MKRDIHGFYGVAVSTLDFESSDPSSNLGRTCNTFFFVLYIRPRFSFRFMENNRIEKSLL